MLVVFEFANNHGGSLERGKQMVDEFRAVADKFPQFEFAMKLQYRDIGGGTYVHPSADPEHPYVKRFRETNLSDTDRLSLKEYAAAEGFLTACTPFDENSVEDVVRHKYDILKVGSPSFADWELWEWVLALWDGTIVASCGGASREEIDKVVVMCKGRELTLMHCVSEYPAESVNLSLGQIQWLNKRYPDVRVGYSSHETFASDGVDIAAVLGAAVIERHVCLDPKPNEYSLAPMEMEWELKCLNEVYRMVGPDRVRVPGPKPIQFMRRDVDGDGRMWWKP